MNNSLPSNPKSPTARYETLLIHFIEPQEFNIANSGRHLIHQGPIFVKKTSDEMYLYLLSDLLILCSNEDQSLTAKQASSLKGGMLSVVDKDPPLDDSFTGVASRRNAFQNQVKSSSHTFHVCIYCDDTGKLVETKYK